MMGGAIIPSSLKLTLFFEGSGVGGAANNGVMGVEGGSSMGFMGDIIGELGLMPG